MAILQTVIDSVEAEGFVIRKEVPILKNFASGSIDYVINNGERVAKDGVVAKVYENNGDILAIKKIAEIDSEIENLNKLNTLDKSLAEGPNILTKQTNSEIRSLLSQLNDEDYKKTTKTKEKILYLLNERQVVTNKVSDFNKKLLSLKQEKEKWLALKKRELRDIKSPVTGVFGNSMDGYENSFSYESVLNLTPEDLHLKTADTNIDKDLCIGKVISESQWYIAFILNKSDTLKLRRDMDIKIHMPSSPEDIPAKVLRINQQNKESEALVVCACDQMNSDTVNARNETFSLNINEHSGIKVPKTAVHRAVVMGKNGTEKEVSGVYVLCGNKVVFKEIIITYADKDYVICEQNPASESLFSAYPLKLYDQVVIEGVKIYDGKIVK
jgi:putative membrane fusion protein